MSIAFSFAGGGAWGGYHVGVVRACLDVFGVNLDDIRVMSGTSTGAFVALKLGMAVATGDMSHITEIQHIYETVQQNDIFAADVADATGFEAGLGIALVMGLVGQRKTAVYDTTPLAELIERYTPKKDVRRLINACKRKRDPIDVSFGCADMMVGRSFVVSVGDCETVEDVRAAVLGSASKPVYMPFVPWRGRRLVDGGIVDNNPIEHVLASESLRNDSTVVSVTLEGRAGVNPESEKNILDVLVRTIAILGADVIQNDLQASGMLQMVQRFREQSPSEFHEVLDRLPVEVQDYILRRSEKCATVLDVQPEKPFTFGGFDFVQPQMKNAVAQGFKEAVANTRLRETLSA